MDDHFLLNLSVCTLLIFLPYFYRKIFKQWNFQAHYVIRKIMSGSV
jgi:hypothetical protein